MRTVLRIAGLALVALALAFDLALLAYEDPANLPGPLGTLAAEHVMPWAQDAVLPWAARLGLVQAVAAGDLAQGEQQETALPESEAPSNPTTSGVLSPTAPTSPQKPHTTYEPLPTSTSVPVASPARVVAPAINLNAPIVKVAVDRSGAMGTPRTAGEVGWYGPRPGEAGNALFAGHVDWVVDGKVTKGSFYLLHRLNPGDEVSVQTADGATLRFRVDWKRYYQAATAPIEEITGPTEQPSITLITCGGPFDRNLRSYVGRWVVRATLLEGRQVNGPLRKE